MNNIESHFLNKLSKILFLEIKEGTKFNSYEFKENVYLPVRSEDVVGKAKDGDDLKNIPVTLFLEGIFFVLGCDKKFKFNEVYKEIIRDIDGSVKFIKGIIFNNVKNEKYEDAYILLKGLLETEKAKENYNKALLLVDGLRNKNTKYKEEELLLIEECKKIDDFSTPYFYEAILKKEDKDLEGALFAINQYISLGGEQTNDVLEFKNSLEIIGKYEDGKELVYEDPKAALEILLPLIDQLGNTVEIYYYVAIAYRVLENNEKAIYYLNEAQAINSDDVAVVNELGINLACIGDYQNAIRYFRAAFEVTKEVDICTNLIMCYLNLGDMEQAKVHLELAEKINPEDEVLKEIKKLNLN
ncbi:tetratricopeptide repeat protein [Clostridium sp. CTA-19]